MGHSPFMDDFTLDVIRDIDTMLDDVESLPNLTKPHKTSH
jgi:hypothetical protein